MVTFLLPRLLADRGVEGAALAEHARGAGALIYRNAYAHRGNLWILLSGLVEPFLYLLSLGVGMGALVGQIPYQGTLVDYPVFVAPAMLAAAAMIGAVTESTYNVFGKMKFMKLYDAVLATPVTPMGVALGEIGWAVLRSAFYSAAFIAIMSLMGLTPSLWTLAALPVAVLAGFAFSAIGVAFTTFLRSWQDFDYITVSIFVLFLFSGTFAPIEAYPGWVQATVTVTPLYHAVELTRALTTGAVSASLLWHVLYLIGLSAVGVLVAARRMRRLLTP